ncbi:unnamed protein product [Rodentolepis nana]|uniref:WH2 domain-containing protein n=1 Tax=Rodentolepis nana TaxID=102285 RepID=A0A0R3TCZ5_RODNA|nr:unnamed protein product [Rodentolepis nana]
MSKAPEIVSEVADFNRSGLNHVEPEVKNPLPTPDDVAKEKIEADLMKEIEQGTKLKHTTTTEKVYIPSAEEIKEEKIEAQKNPHARS